MPLMPQDSLPRPLQKTGVCGLETTSRLWLLNVAVRRELQGCQQKPEGLRPTATVVHLNKQCLRLGGIRIPNH